MAFVCTITDGNFSGSVFKKGNAHAVIYLIGYDDTEDRSYFLFVSLDPVIGEDDGLELSFRVIEYDAEADSEYAYWSGKDTASFIKGDDRKAILAILSMAANHLLNSAKPSKVLACSMDKDSPERANKKFMLLAHVFEKCGYSVTTWDTYHGLRCWWMERNSTASS